MSRRKTAVIWTLVVFGILTTVFAAVFLHRRQPVTLRGAVLQQDRDPNKQLPLAEVEIVATNALGSAVSVSDSSGAFSLTLPKGLRRRQQVLLQFRRKDYRPIDRRVRKECRSRWSPYH